jgi:hypothetical protein
MTSTITHSENFIAQTNLEKTWVGFDEASMFPRILRTPIADQANGLWHSTCAECGLESEWLATMNGMSTIKFAMQRHLWDDHKISQPALLPK